MSRGQTSTGLFISQTVEGSKIETPVRTSMNIDVNWWWQPFVSEMTWLGFG